MMKSIREYVAARRAVWRADRDSTIRFETVFYRNALTKEEKRAISQRERVPVELINIGLLDELELVDLLLSRIRTEITQLKRVADQLKTVGVKLRRSRQIKIDLAVLRAEREWLSGQRDAIEGRGCEKNTKFAALRQQLKAGEIAGTFTPVEPKRRTRGPTLAEQTVVFKGADEIAAYIAARETGEWERDPAATVDFEKTVYREAFGKAERERVKEVNPGVPKWFLAYGKMSERQTWQLRMSRAKALANVYKAQYLKRTGAARRRVVANLRAVYAEIEWLRHKRDAFEGKGEWDVAFTIRWNERIAAKAEERAQRAAARAERRKAKAEERARKAGLVVYRAVTLTQEQQREARNEWQRRYRAMKRQIGEAVNAPSAEPRKRAVYATEEERRAARRERSRRYHLLRKSGLWVRKNRVFSERIARSAGIEVTEGLVIDAMYKREGEDAQA